MFGKELFGSTPFGGILGRELGVQKTLRYVVVAPSTIQKNLRYAIQAEVKRERPQLSLQYRVRVRYQDKYQPKGSEYTEKYQPQESEYADKYSLKGTKYRKRY